VLSVLRYVLCGLQTCCGRARHDRGPSVRCIPRCMGTDLQARFPPEFGHHPRLLRLQFHLNSILIPSHSSVTFPQPLPTSRAPTPLCPVALSVSVECTDARSHSPLLPSVTHGNPVPFQLSGQPCEQAEQNNGFLANLFSLSAVCELSRLIPLQLTNSRQCYATIRNPKPEAEDTSRSRKI
jgi:hypothetical protein